MQEQFWSEVVLAGTGARLQKRRLVKPREHISCTWDTEKIHIRNKQVSRAMPTPPTSHSSDLGFTKVENDLGKCCFPCPNRVYGMW